MNIAFLHLDLGLGGAERLVVDAGVALQARGHRVTIFTSHHDPGRCFEETRDGTLRVCEYGDFLPSHVADRGRAPAAILRMLYLSLRVRLRRERFDAFFCDLVAHAVPALKLWGHVPVIFYCHYPDSLLATARGGLYRLYRWPIDWCEERSMATADEVLVNSEFTARVLARTLPRVARAEVVYPGVALDADPATSTAPDPSDTFTILCLSRFELKKNLRLAIDSLLALRSLLSAAEFARMRLVIAGGYDERLRDSRALFSGLERLSETSGMAAQIQLVRSPKDAEREALMRGCQCVVFTAENEHFGYVPVEAMAAGKPVVAVASGGPLETMQDGETGFLCAPEAQAFALCLARLVREPELRRRYGAQGRARVHQHFSRQTFGARLGSIVERMVAERTAS
jgi:alpha-1,3/alpha-1,6-mannosyltransferase